MDTWLARRLVVQTISRLAPGVDPASLDGGADLRDELGLDSIGFLQLVDLMSRRVGHLIQECDQLELTTIDGCVRSLLEQPGQADHAAVA
ncbi:acyl carrier protein [Actinomadura barringtoniae]|uniref:Acyl carrier protein n=1 Tax=Actinomadura barringtoniae TaxID=1427535 RepID=A0A939P8X9_9ACTN|nr:acyl carrier protein [Actinomadura barringtoniae]MBO2448040.1 acyl carrier protein [Actinomadura barringtoniae]